MVRFWPNLSRRQVYSLLPLLHTGNTVLFYFVFAFSSSPSTLKTKYSWEMDFGNPPPQKQINNLTLNGLICVRANLQKNGGMYHVSHLYKACIAFCWHYFFCLFVWCLCLLTSFGWWCCFGSPLLSQNVQWLLSTTAFCPTNIQPHHRQQHHRHSSWTLLPWKTQTALYKGQCFK